MFIIITVGSARASGRQRGSVVDETTLPLPSSTLVVDGTAADVNPWHHKAGLPRHTGPEPPHSEVSG